MIHIFTAWHFIGLAILLLILEALAGKGYSFWIAMTALITGFIVFMAPSMSWLYSSTLFVFLALIVTFFWWMYRRFHPKSDYQTKPPPPGKTYIGQTFTLLKPIKNGIGYITADTYIWRIVSNKDAPKGAQVTVYGVDGVVLKVKVLANTV